MKLKILLLFVAALIIFLAILVFIRQLTYRSPASKITPSSSSTINRELIVNLKPANNSKWKGTAKIVNLPVRQFKIMFESSVSTSSAKPFHIILGTCDKLGPISHVLSDILFGKSESVKDGSIEMLLNSPHSLVVQKSKNDLIHEIACGEIVEKAK